MSEEYGQPIGEVLGAQFRVSPLPTGWTALDGVVLIKTFDDEGHSSWALRQTDGINDEELIGILTVQLDITRERVLDSYRDYED